jgi:transcriptional regulator with XRE-family HTH domain
MATDDTLRLCTSERDAVLVSIQLSGLTYSEIGSRCGVTKQAVEKWARNGVPEKRERAFMNATGTRLVEQYRMLQDALRVARGCIRESDRIARIASLTKVAAA